MDYLVVMNRRHLGIPQPRRLRSHEGELLDQVWTRLRDGQARDFTRATLTAPRNHPTPTAEGRVTGKASGVTDETEVDRGAILPHSIEFPDFDGDGAGDTADGPS
jgi:hypothetical protein